MMLRAVKEDRFYVLTHPASAELFAALARRIVAGENPVEPDLSSPHGERGEADD